MEQAIQRVRGVETSRETLVSVLGEETADEKINELIAAVAIPDNIEDFKEMVTTWFLKNGVPVRVFQYPWVTSLDDSEGQVTLYSEFEEAFEHSRDPAKVYRARNNKIFTTPDK